MRKLLYMKATLLFKNRPSNGAIALRQSIPSLRLLKNPDVINLARLSKYKAVLNWGTTEMRLEPLRNILNKPSAVAVAVNKIKSFQLLKENNVNVPDFWTKQEEVVRKAGAIIFARKTVTGSSGVGIVPVREGEPLPDALLYVSYIRKNAEYRVHIFKDQVIFIQQKLAKGEVARTNDQNLIRSHCNGWVFAENQVAFATPEIEAAVRAQSLAAVKVIGLDFGAVDVVVSKKDGAVFVLEINTAPGLESTALMSAYHAALTGIL